MSEDNLDRMSKPNKRPLPEEWIEQAEKQEPVKMVAYNCLCGRIMKFESVNGIVAPQREWVGLTNAELAEFSDMELGAYDLCLEVEAKLRSKNT
jgi:hypothetical protein